MRNQLAEAIGDGRRSHGELPSKRPSGSAVKRPLSTNGRRFKHRLSGPVKRARHSRCLSAKSAVPCVVDRRQLAPAVDARRGFEEQQRLRTAATS